MTIITWECHRCVSKSNLPCFPVLMLVDEYNWKMKQVIVLQLLVIPYNVAEWGYEHGLRWEGTVLTFKTIAARSWVLMQTVVSCMLPIFVRKSSSIRDKRSITHTVLYPTFFNTDAARWLHSSRVSVTSTIHVQDSSGRIGISIARENKTLIVPLI